MFYGFTPKCPKCGRELRGVTLDYNQRWECSDCVEDKEDPIHCESGCKVAFVYPENGREHEREEANRLLTVGTAYEVEAIRVGGFFSEIELKELRACSTSGLSSMRTAETLESEITPPPSSSWMTVEQWRLPRIRWCSSIEPPALNRSLRAESGGCAGRSPS